MAKRMNDGVELIKTLAGSGRGGSRPKPPEAVARGASLGAPRPLPDHEKAKRCLTANTVALSRRRSPKIQATIPSRLLFSGCRDIRNRTRSASGKHFFAFDASAILLVRMA